jgi:nitrate reductase gamma subunit
MIRWNRFDSLKRPFWVFTKSGHVSQHLRPTSFIKPQHKKISIVTQMKNLLNYPLALGASGIAVVFGSSWLNHFRIINKNTRTN